MCGRKINLITILLLLLLASCNSTPGGPGEGTTSKNTGTTSTQSGGGGGGPGGTDNGNINGGNQNGNDGGYLSRFKPALAVRATGCIMCHGRVEANIITDFGYGNDYFFGRGSGLSEFSGSIYGDHAENWNTAKVWGKIYVPSAPVTLPGNPATSLSSYLQSVVTAPDATTPAPEVSAQSQVYIGVPTEQRILNIAGPFQAGTPWKFFSTTQSNFDSLEVDVTGNYVRNRPGQIFQCEGDLVVNKILLLDNLQLSTGNKGCRIYATKSVFVQGAINYLGNSPLRHLQIMSTRAVLLGMGPGPVIFFGSVQGQNSLVFRFQSMWTRPGFMTREAGTTGDKLDLIVNESYLVPELVDADSQPGGRGVAFERLLINTPNFQSRYQGEFKGSIIAELALGSLNNFAFKFDDVLSQVAVFPLVQESEFLRITP